MSLIEFNLGMNWEVAALKKYKFEAFIPDIQTKLRADELIESDSVISLNLVSKNESDGTPYGDTADYWYLQIECPGLAHDKTVGLKQGMFEVLSLI